MRDGNDQRQGCMACVNHLNNPLPHCGAVQTDCQIGVFLTYASRHGIAFIDRHLYLPQIWTADRDRCRRAGIPDTAGFTTKPATALTMLQRAVATQVTFRWVTGDSLYGDHRPIRQWLETVPCGYVFAVSGKEYVWQGWHQVRRSIHDPTEVRAFVYFASADTPLATLVQVAGRRWTVEQCIAETKGEVGLDHYEVRSWQGWYRHITLACLAHALLVVLRNQVPSVLQAEPQRGLRCPAVRNSLTAFKAQRGLASTCIAPRIWHCKALPNVLCTMIGHEPKNDSGSK